MADENYNSQFLQIDFQLLEDPAFLEFVGRAEFCTYLLLRRYIWRGGGHRLGLHELYWDKKLLVSAVGREKIADKLGLKDYTRISKHLAALEDMRVIKRLRTGRETIFVLGEWVDISENQDKSARKEWFYIERRFGVKPSSDVAQNATSEVQKSQHQKWPETPLQTWRNEPPSNIESNIKSVNVKNGDKKTHLRQLQNQNEPVEKIDYLTDEILSQLGDKHSTGFYRLVASKIPEHVIRQALSEIKSDGAQNPAKVFTFKMENYAKEALAQVSQ